MESVSIANTKVSNRRKTRLIDRVAKQFVLKALSQIRVGHLTIEDEGQVYSFGEPIAQACVVAHVNIVHRSAYRDVMFNSSIGGGEAFMKHAWTTPDLLSLMRLMVKNLSLINKLDNQRPWFSRLTTKLMHLLNSNTKEGSRKNISAHYDLGNDFFELFLDSSMMYSAAIYPTANASLEEAATYKLDHICKRLELSPEDHLLEIGTGWGGMAIHAARHYGCRVTTTTISKEQFAYAKAKVNALGLDDRVTVLMEDYRDLRGQFDKLVSIEMIEAVGHQFYGQYFQQCSRLLKPHGLMLIQAITIADQRYQDAKTSVDFIQKYIFPGGSLPSNEVIARCVSRYTDMQLLHLDDITLDYAKTLADWRAAFHANIEQVKTQGFDEVFCRMWDFYLCYCEGGFRERAISTGQFLLGKPQYRFPERPME